MKAIAVDDEPKALDVIRLFAEKIPFLNLEGVFTDAMAALEYLHRESPDLVFLDIKMPDISGLDWVKGLVKPPMIIFTTAYSEFAAESYELEAVDYLVKPIAFNRFLKAVNRAAKIRQQQEGEFTFVKSGHQYVRIDFADLLYLQSATNYVDFFTTKGRPTVRLKLSEAADLLPEQFIQVHRSYIINLAKVTRIEHNHIEIGEARIAIGQAYRNAFMKKLLEK